MADLLPPPLDVDTVWAVVDEERLGLAALLEGLSEQQWGTPSLCAGWRVRDVAAHLTLAHTGPVAATVGIARAGGSFDRMVRDTARRHAAVPTGQLVAELRAMAGSRRRAPGISHLEPMLDVLVHGQDIAIPIGVPRPVPVVPAAAAATRVWTMGWPMSRAFRARSRLRRLRLVATDVDWAVGEGPPIEGPIGALLLLLTGRSAVALGHLSGPGANLLVPAGR